MRTTSLLALALGLLFVTTARADPPATAELAELDARLIEAPGDVEARIERARTLLDLSEPARALEDVRELEALAPADGRALLLRAGCLVALGDLPGARAVLDDGAIERTPRIGEALAVRARIALAMGEPEAARADLDRALVELAEPDLYLLRARIEAQLGRDPVDGLAEGLVRTGSVVIEEALARALAAGDRMEEALAVLDASALPDVRRRLMRARLLSAMGRSELARGEANAALVWLSSRAMRRPSAARHLELALGHALAGDCEDARAHLGTARALSPAYAAAEHPGLGAVAATVAACGGAR